MTARGTGSDGVSGRQPEVTLSWPQVCARRLARHGLAEPWTDASPADAVAAICGAHAQVMSAAELSVGIRLRGTTRSSVQSAVEADHTLVKTFGPRGTVHLLPTRDLPLWAGALAALWVPPTHLPPDALMTEDQTDSVIVAIGEALRDTELTLDELTEAVVERAGAWAGDPVVPAWYGFWPRWRPAMYPAAARGVLCFGPTRGRTVTYTNPHRYLPDLQPLDPAAAGAELVRRYLHSYGPATPADFARWLGVALPAAKSFFEALSGELAAVSLDGGEAWVLSSDTQPSDAPAGGVRLLPYFDAYAIGCQPRALVFPGRASERALSGGQAGNYPVLLIDGVVAGVWHLKRSGRRAAVTVEPLGKLSAAQRQELDEQVALVGEVLESRAELTLGTVTVGPHA